MSHWEASAGATDEWYTPKYIFDALGCRFDLDVAAPEAGAPHVPSDAWIFEDSLDLDMPWEGFVWMNPPFGGRNSLSPWLAKFFDHGNGIALTPDRTSAPWFREAWARADLVMFMPKVKFLRPNGSLGKQPSNGTALWAAGSQAVSALDRAAANGLGILAEPAIARHSPAGPRPERARFTSGDGSRSEIAQPFPSLTGGINEQRN